MIRGFANRDLELLHRYKKPVKGISPAHVARLLTILAALDIATHPQAVIGPPGWRLHRWMDSDVWSIDVDGRWRVTFRFSGRDVIDVDYTQPH